MDTLNFSLFSTIYSFLNPKLIMSISQCQIRKQKYQNNRYYLYPKYQWQDLSKGNLPAGKKNYFITVIIINSCLNLLITFNKVSGNTCFTIKCPLFKLNAINFGEHCLLLVGNVKSTTPESTAHNLSHLSICEKKSRRHFFLS